MAVRFESLVDQVADFERVPRHIAQALVDTENAARDPSIVIKEAWGGGSHGLTMVTLRIAQSLGFNGTSGQLLEPTVNLTYGLRHLRNMFDKVGRGDWGRARWAYNVGEDLVPDWPSNDKARFLRNVAKWGPLKSAAAPPPASTSSPPSFQKPPTPIQAGAGGSNYLSLFLMLGVLIPFLWRQFTRRRRR
jgi:transglycosylase-like protein with SLT domain